jgi:LacI family transcriptional regulator
MGALMALYESNIRIPDDISLIGFGDYGLSQITRPSLSVIDKPTWQLGAQAAELLLRRINGDYSDFPRQIRLQAKLVVNDSVSSPRI